MGALRIQPRSVSIHRRQVVERDADDERFLSYAEPVCSLPTAAVLLSGGAHDCSRFSIAAWNPFATVTSRGSTVCVQSSGQRSVHRGDPIELLDSMLDALRPDYTALPAPFSGGAVGYFTYNLKNRIERLPRRARDDLRLPELFLFFPRDLLLHDRQTGMLERITLRFAADPEGDREEISLAPAGAGAGWFRAGALGSDFSRESYLKAVRKIRTYIRNGDVYQVNLSQRFRFSLEGDPFRLWRSLFDLNPAPFYAFVQAGDHQVISTSMERFLCREGSAIESRPIKGTRPRGGTRLEDDALQAELSASPKDGAELSMIVDLIRNDLGRICEPLSVKVREHRRLETYQNVHHLVSIVTGALPPGISHGRILRAMFPGGSITGCPKIRAMEIIDELEPHARHVYTGAIGYLGWHRNLDLSIAIRTALVHRGTCYLSVGGAVVYDSDPEEEYRETLHKGRSFFQVIGRSGGQP